ncbi:MAG: hypothetical protein CMA02_01880, partial [Euryarchaeota archaeon]|nr:hypothetical protein [Euryarchaeota archaeon]
NRYLIITVDTEAQPPRQSEDHVGKLIYGRTEVGDLGITEMMDIADSNEKKITFFVDIMAELVYPGEISQVCKEIYGKGHDVQLHAHPEFVPSDFWKDRGIEREGSMNLWNLKQSRSCIRWMVEKMSEWGIEGPVAIRGGGYRYNSNILIASEENGINLDFNYYHLHRKIPLTEKVQPQPFNIGNLPMFSWSNGVIEVPVSTIRMEEDFAKSGSRKRLDEYFIRDNADSINELFDAYFKECKGPQVLVMVLHSWSFLGFDDKTGFYEYQGLEKRDSFEKFLQNLPDDIEVITAKKLSEMISDNKIRTKVSVDVDIANYGWGENV